MENEDVSPTKGRLEFRRILKGSVETVWRFLVEDDLRGKWLCYGKVEPFEGGKIEFKFDPENFDHPKPPNISAEKYKTQFAGRVIIYSPPEKLMFSWPEANGLSETHVTITLKAAPEGTSLLLVHEKLKSEDHLIGASAGWHAHLEQLECHLSRQLSPNFWKRHEALDLDYRKKLEEME